MATLTSDMQSAFDTTIAIGEYGTQFFYFDPTSQKFEYALPLVSGGEYGGETETFEAPEMDLDYVAKISGRTTLDDITLTSNYTKDRYKRWTQILNNISAQVYLEVYSDGSATMFSGTSGRPTIQGGDVRQIEVTIAPTNMVWVEDVNSVQTDAVEEINDMLSTVVVSELTTPINANKPLPFDDTTIPAKREQFYDEVHTAAQTYSTQTTSYGI